MADADSEFQSGIVFTVRWAGVSVRWHASVGICQWHQSTVTTVRIG